MSFRPLIVAATLAIAWPLAALANPALNGTWIATIDGQRVTVTFDGRGGGRADGRPIRYEVQGSLLAVEDQGAVSLYQFQLQGGQLLVAGGQLPGVVTFVRGTEGAAAAPSAPDGGRIAAAGGNPDDLVGKWCKMSTFSASGGGGSSSSACFELRADGSYVYGAESSRSAYGGGMYGATSGSSADTGRWSVSGSTITAHSRSGQVSTYQLERRNHPKNRDPMLCLDGECYVTFFRRDPW